ncbi:MULTISPECIES: phosphopantetheine-binding protein [Methylobacterium]|uniref:Aminoacyl carrier protein 1 n=1 Tax=Methylobacterium jeotgali TaxID=381630 RepID=A0ABQ4SYF5_9HYPH|nr:MULTISPECIES: phosphopantetheine-binding protein [Methylobacterium]PIU06260.1 MAG: acyl carrier protein [Methylobacterium sp. CG09_land_8_20_14_0_10_71_15]PIU14551.1 MAG: acyl carrier protein [Methylobacterium sp. CG08_land_8_20_14_0_20_71_15]GBU18977.1 aminoacyl carrier protein 1 [Methylobacterium sp.]GJE07525.1 Aminoacyl carrier protein 1 [Methylobacterium jeotgali]
MPQAFAATVDRTMALAGEIAARHATVAAFRPEDALTEVGLTSLDLVNLMLAVEAEFDIMIPPSCLNPQNFHSIEAIARMVEAVRAGTFQ